MNVALLAGLTVVSSMAVIVPAYAVLEPIEYVASTCMNRISALGNHTFELTLTDLLKDGNSDEIRGKMGYGVQAQ